MRKRRAEPQGPMPRVRWVPIRVGRRYREKPFALAKPSHQQAYKVSASENHLKGEESLRGDEALFQLDELAHELYEGGAIYCG